MLASWLFIDSQNKVNGTCWPDTAKGKEDGDYDAAYVIEERTGEMCAALHGKWDTDLYGKKLNTLGLYYNTGQADCCSHHD
ncbi:hypothetical protein [Paenibacillus terrae]|uniref:hypothetical protein n=1 Tax=Paenibacillus terrae TaxID=159743 RepID=UPI001F312BBF|nr:hypothetical protein [Paenibacillus terrae]